MQEQQSLCVPIDAYPDMSVAPRDTSYRNLLPADLEPEVYNLTLEPNLEKFTFEGVVKVSCDVKVASDVVSLHAKELLVSEAEFTLEGGGKPVEAVEISLKKKETIVTLTFEEPLPVGKGQLMVKFIGKLNDQLFGFYPSKYKDSAGAQQYMATTKFEPHGARRCFPCWDEPGRKAIFIVTLIYPANLTAVSNMPQSHSTTLDDGRKKQVFLPTPKMSTYLLAFCIGEFEFISGQTKDGVIARVITVPGKASLCSYALKVCMRALEFFNDFFAEPYPLPKMDMIAIPDFASGAMENWGLVTYREALLLCDEKTVSAQQKQRICTVITHEISHQWFGNLVTMEWWDDLWLNEGFANWMQTFVADKLHPEWKIWEGYVAVEQKAALQLDALRSSHPIQVPIKNVEEVQEVFDTISYCKGGSVIRMIYALLGEEKFQEGLRLYFERHRYGNTETADLWQAWSQVSGKPIDHMMRSWTEQMGFPVIKVLGDPIDTGATEIEVEQSWFLADGSVQPGDAERLWVVPVFAGGDKGMAPVALLEQAQQIIQCDIVAGASFVKLNFGQHVPCRVLYPDSMVTRLAAAIESSSIPAEDRIGLLSDSYAFVKSGATRPEVLVKLLEGFGSEMNDKVWSELSATLTALDMLMKQVLNPDVYALFIGWAGQLVSPAFSKVGWAASGEETDNKKMLRSTLLGLVAKFCTSDTAIVAEAKKLCGMFLRDPTDATVVTSDVRPAVLSISMKTDGFDEVYKQLVEVHNSCADGQIQQEIYAALGGTVSTAFRKRALEWSLSSDVKQQDLIYIPLSVARSGRDGADEVFAWIQEHFEDLSRIEPKLFQLIVKISGVGFVTFEKADALKNFWETKSVFNSIEKTLGQTLEGILSNAKFAERLKNSKLSDAAYWATPATPPRSAY